MLKVIFQCVLSNSTQLFLFNRGDFFKFPAIYSTLLHLPPLRYHCVGGCWDATSALAVRRSTHSARSLFVFLVEYLTAMGKAALICGCTVPPVIPLSATSSSTLHAAAHHIYQEINVLFHWRGIL